MKILFDRIDEPGLNTLEVYERRDGYQSLRKALSMSREDVLSQLMEGGDELPSGFPGLPAPAPARPVVSGNKGTKKKKKGGRVTPPKGR